MFNKAALAKSFPHKSLYSCEKSPSLSLSGLTFSSQKSVYAH